MIDEQDHPCTFCRCLFCDNRTAHRALELRGSNRAKPRPCYKIDRVGAPEDYKQGNDDE